MTGGVITGGWSFVWAAYGISGAVFLVYAVTVFSRLRSARKLEDPSD